MLMCARVFINHKSCFYHNKSTKRATHGKTCYSWQHLEVRGQTESYMLPSCHQCTIWSKSILVISEKKELFFVLEAIIDPYWVPKLGWYYVSEHLARSERTHEGVGESHSAWADYEWHRYKSISTLTVYGWVHLSNQWVRVRGEVKSKGLTWLRRSKDCTSVRKYMSNHPSIKLIHRRGGREGSWERDRDNLRLPIRSSFTCGYRTSWLA